MMLKNLCKEISKRNYTLNALNISGTINVDISLNIMMRFANIVDSFSLRCGRNITLNTYLQRKSINKIKKYQLKPRGTLIVLSVERKRHIIPILSIAYTVRPQRKKLKDR